MLFSRFSQQIRYFHRSTFLLARGIRRSNELPPVNTERNLSVEEEDESNSMSVQEQFARLELQRLEQESNAMINEDNQDLDDDDEQNLGKISIDPSTTSIILFPGQGTQFVGMG